METINFMVKWMSFLIKVLMMLKVELSFNLDMHRLMGSRIKDKRSKVRQMQIKKKRIQMMKWLFGKKK